MAASTIGNFTSTAAYFEARAKTRTNSDHRRQKFAEAASFYRALANITPRFPRGYKEPPNWNAVASSLSKRAEECRAIAAVTRNAECKAKLLRLAQTFERVSTGPALRNGVGHLRLGGIRIRETSRRSRPEEL